MDALLAGYESDSEDSSSSDNKHVSHIEGRSKKLTHSISIKQKVQTASLPSLLGDGVDSCSSSSEDEVKADQPPQQSHSSHTFSSYKCDVNINFLAQRKKQRCLTRENSNHDIKHEENISFLARNRLPSPRAGSFHSVQSESMISWGTNYLSQNPSHREGLSSSPMDASNSTSNSQFKKLAASLTSDKNSSWAANIKNQQEFHNPHIFQSVIERFGINEPLGSQAEYRTMIN